jgi:hypothetical protein
LNNNSAMNVKPKNYSWTDFYSRVVDLTKYSFSWRNIGRRFKHTHGAIPKWMNVVRAVSSEGFGRTKYYGRVRELLDTDLTVRRYFDGETDTLPAFYTEKIKRDLGAFWDHLPDGALRHDPNAYLHAEQAGTAPVMVTTAGRARAPKAAVS